MSVRGSVKFASRLPLAHVVWPGLVLGVGFLPGLASAGTVDRVAAVVGDEVIAWSEIYDTGGEFISERCGATDDARGSCRRGAELEVLDALIRGALIKQELIRLGIGTTPDEVDRAIDRVARDYGLEDRDALRREVDKAGVGWDDYRNQLEDQIQQVKFTENVIRPRVTVTDAEVEDLYKRMSRDVVGASTIALQGFFVALPADLPAEERAAKLAGLHRVVSELRDGKRDWMTTLVELDAGPYAARNGEMGTFGRGQLSPAVEAAVFDAPVGAYGDPVDLGPGALVVKLVSRSATSDIQPLEAVKEQLRAKIVEGRLGDEVTQWYQQTRRHAAIKILLETVSSE